MNAICNSELLFNRSNQRLTGVVLFLKAEKVTALEQPAGRKIASEPICARGFKMYEQITVFAFHAFLPDKEFMWFDHIPNNTHKSAENFSTRFR